MAYYDAVSKDFSQDYDGLIKRMLQSVDRDQEYNPTIDKKDGKETVDSHKVGRYRTIFIDSLKKVLSRTDIPWLKQEVKLIQGMDLDEGWAYLPTDFVVAYSLGARMNYLLPDMSLNNDGKMIHKGAGTKLVYLRAPRNFDEMSSEAYECLKAAFLYALRLVDPGLAEKADMLKEDYFNASRNLDSQVRTQMNLSRNRRPLARLM